MSANRKTKKKIIAASIVSVLVVALALGLWFFLQYRNDQKTVEVIPVSQIADYYWGDQSSCSGMVVSDYVQELYPQSDKIISEVFVEEGQEVKIGDPLLQYDKTKLELDVRFKKNALDEADLRIQTAQKQLKKLQNTKPVATAKPTAKPTARPNPTKKPTPTARPTPTPTPTPVPPGDATLHNRLDLNSVPYLGSGTTEDPYVFLCTDDCVITPEFLQWLLGYGVEEEPTPEPEESSGLDDEEQGGGDGENTEDGEDGEGGETGEDPGTEATPTPEPTPTPRPSKLVSPFAAVFEVRDGGSNYGQLISSFRLDGTKLSGGFQLSGSIPATNTLDSLATMFGASPTPSADNYNDMGYTAAELRELIAEKKREITDLQHSRKLAQLDLDKANLLLKNSTVLSNVDGVVRSLLDLETASAEGKPFLVVSGDSTYYVAGAISENLLGIVQVGDQVTVNDYMTGGTYTAQIVSIADYPLESDSNLYYYGGGNPNSSSYEFTAVVDQGDGLQNGSYVDITLEVQDEDAANALFIQKAYVRSDDAGHYVMKAGIDNRLLKQYVQVGRTIYSSSLEIKSGLTIDDYVAFPYGADVVEGVRVVAEGTTEPPLPGASQAGDLPEGGEVLSQTASLPEGGESSGEADWMDREDGEGDVPDGGIEPLPEDGEVVSQEEAAAYTGMENEGGVTYD